MSRYPIQRYTKTVTIPVNSDTAEASVVEQLNGMLRGITVVAPNATGSSFTVTITGQRGEVLFQKASIATGATSFIRTDANNFPLAVPLALVDVSPVTVKSAGTPDAAGELTFSDAGAIADGDTVTIGDEVYRFKNSIAQAFDVLIEADVKAQGTITSDGTNPSNDEQFVIGSRQYTFKDTLTGAADEIKIGADAATTLDNIKSAINASAGAGTAYGTGTTANTAVTATTNDDTTQIIEAVAGGTAGNSIVFTENASHITMDGSGLLGTTQAGAWSGDDTLQNLVDAINLEDGSGQSGTKYHASTTASSYVTAGAVASHATALTAVEAVVAGTDVATTTTAAELTFGDVTLTTGGEAAERSIVVDLHIERE